MKQVDPDIQNELTALNSKIADLLDQQERRDKFHALTKDLEQRGFDRADITRPSGPYDPMQTAVKGYAVINAIDTLKASHADIVAARNVERDHIVTYLRNRYGLDKFRGHSRLVDLDTVANEIAKNEHTRHVFPK